MENIGDIIYESVVSKTFDFKDNTPLKTLVKAGVENSPYKAILYCENGVNKDCKQKDYDKHIETAQRQLTDVINKLMTRNYNEENKRELVRILRKINQPLNSKKIFEIVNQLDDIIESPED